MSTPTNLKQDPTVKKRPKYVRAIGPRLRRLLVAVLVLLAVLVANSAYLGCVTLLEWISGKTYQNYFYLSMFLAHLVLGLLLVIPFLVFAITHMRNTWRRRNRYAVRAGIALFVMSILVILSGIALMRVGSFDLKSPSVRTGMYWCHIITPLVAAWLYWLHRLIGPRIKWRWGAAYLAVVATAVVAMFFFHSSDPRQWNEVGPAEGDQYFFPSLSRTVTGNFIPADTLMMDSYCKECHEDVHKTWTHSAHRLSSFNNPAYLATIRVTRAKLLERDGTVQGARFCAACHDPVPFFSGAFDDPHYDDVSDATAHAGITCTVCHAITHVNSPRGNADFTIEEPQHYPFTFSDNEVLSYINRQLVKAKPSLHKKTFLKPLHKTTEFCGTCHKVHLPVEVNHYKFLRGQNHYDSFLLSGVSGHGARSFYYPDHGEQSCNQCHMPLREADEFGAQYFDDAKSLSVHDHLFPSANTAVGMWSGGSDIVKQHEKFNTGVMRVDLFGLRESGSIDGKLHAPLRPSVPQLKPGGKYLLEAVIRTLKMGHHFTQGTADSNQIWLEVTVTSGSKVIGSSGGVSVAGEVDPWAYFVNAFVLDRAGNRIARRNAEDIFISLYNHQIPPGADATVHYELSIPEDLDAPVEVEVKLRYRKFDTEYLRFIAQSLHGSPWPIGAPPQENETRNNLPVLTLAEDHLVFPVEGVAKPDEVADLHESSFPVWQRWNDYGIGLLLSGRKQLRQAAEAFQQVEQLDRYDGALNLARVYFQEGQLDKAAEALQRADQFANPAPPAWTLAWFSGLVNRQQGHLQVAADNFQSILENRAGSDQIRERGFDFSKDYVVLNAYGATLFDLAKQQPGQQELLKAAAEPFESTLKLDPENITAHHNLHLIYRQLQMPELAEQHARLHAMYKTDDNARDRAFAAARKKYPAANHAVESSAIYSLTRPGTPQLPAVPIDDK